MYNNIPRVKFISIDVNRYLFYRIFKKKTIEVLIKKHKISDGDLEGPEFIRFKYCGEYMDIKIVSVTLKRDYLIRLGTVVDTSVAQRNIKLK